YAALSVVAALNELYTNALGALRAIDRVALEQALRLVASRRDVAVARVEAVEERREVADQAEVLEGEILGAEDAQTQVDTQINILSGNTINLGGLTLTIERLKASLASIKISFETKALFSGVIEVAGTGLEKAVAAVKAAADAVKDAAKDISGAAEALETLLKPLGRVRETGEALADTVRRAWRRLFPPREELPWPTGLRLLPPAGREDDPRDVDLVEVRRFKAGKRFIRAIAPMPGGRFVAGGDDGRLYVFALDQEAALAVLEGHKDYINRAAVLDATRVVTASADESLILWDLKEEMAVRTYTGHGDWVQDVAALGQQRFASVGDDGHLRLWDAETEAPLADHAVTNPTGLAALAPDRVVTGPYDEGHHLQVIDAEDGRHVFESQHDSADIWKAAAVGRDQVLTVRANSEQLCLWQIGQQDPVAVMEGPGICQDAALLSTTRAISAHDRGVALWSLPDGAGLAQALPGPELRGIRALPPAPGGPPRFVAGGEDGYLALWEVRPKA
ncbi:MAG: WD40 repeat domain-containing protein, partial [Pseudomonadota bacterium]